MAVLPIRRAGFVCGTLSVYATERGFFQEREIALLDEAAADLSFGLDNFARDRGRAEAEAAARRDRHLVDTIVESVPGVLYLYDEGGRTARVMAIAVHPYISGVPHRIKYFEQIYAYMKKRRGVWFCKG